MNLHYDPLDQKWSLYHKGRFYLWKGDPFDRAAAEATAKRLIARAASPEHFFD